MLPLDGIRVLDLTRLLPGADVYKRQIYYGKVAGPNPWRALTLEWQTSSPPPSYNFKGNPIPYEDPYGYGTEAANAYLDAMAERLTPAAQLKSGKAGGPSLPSPEPVVGD